MHSSWMRTARLLTVSQQGTVVGCSCPGGVPTQGVYLLGWVYLPGGVPIQGVHLLGWVYLLEGGVPAWVGVYLSEGYLPGGLPA